MASTVVQQLYSRTTWLTDGADEVWNFTFTGGYIDPSHISAFVENLDTGSIEAVPINLATMLIGPYQLRIVPALPAGRKLTIARVTPRDLPLVDFQDGGDITEYNLDTNAKQAVFIAAESLDAVLAQLLKTNIDNDFGFKSMHQEPYTGASVLGILDNGRSHYKTDATPVTVPNTLKVEFLSTIINDSDSVMTITFTGGGAILQGSSDIIPYATWQLGPRQLLSLTKVADGRWYISGKVDRA